MSTIRKTRPSIHKVRVTAVREKWQYWGWANLAEVVECANNIREDNPQFLSQSENLETSGVNLLLLFGHLMKGEEDLKEDKGAILFTFLDDGNFYEKIPHLPVSLEKVYVPSGWANTVLELIELGVHRVECQKYIPYPTAPNSYSHIRACFRDDKKEPMTPKKGHTWKLSLRF